MNCSNYIFTKDGNLVESDYRTLKTSCKTLGIPYGRCTEDGFVPHDLRHNFVSDLICYADIETTRELLDHSNIEQTGDYLHTDERLMRDAIRDAKDLPEKRNRFDL
jgi:integrase